MDLDLTDPANPANYQPHPLGYCCRDCNASAKIGQAVRHSCHCDIAPKQYVLPADQAEGESSKRAARRGTSANQKARRDAAKRPSIRESAADGSVRLHYTDSEIALAVRNGEISASDAMNQDY